MSSYSMVDLRGNIGRATDVLPLVWEASIDASEISALTIALVCDSVSAGINALNPALVTIDHTFDDGLTWVALSNLNGGVVSGAGTFLTSVSLNTGLVAPVIRVTLTAPAGESLMISRARKNRFLPGTIISFAGTALLGGTSVFADMRMQYGAGGVYANTRVTLDTSTPGNTRPVPVFNVNSSGVEESLTIARGPAGVFVKTKVAHDTTTPANTRPVPMLGVDAAGVHETMTYQSGPGGVYADQRVILDSSTPTNTKPLPVIQVGSSGNQMTEGAGVELQAARTVEAGMRAAKTPVYRDCAVSALNTGAWTEVLAAAAGAVTELRFWNGTGYPIQIAYGNAGGFEALEYILPPGGEAVRLWIPSATRVSVQPYVNITGGELVINFMR